MAVLSAGGPDYRDEGVRLGDFIVRPAISETAGFDQNPLGLPNGKSSLKVDSSASIDAQSDWTRHAFGISASVDDVRYTNLPVANQSTVTAFAGGRIDLDRDSIDLSVGHVQADLGPTDVFTQGLVAPVPYSSNDLRGAYSWHFNRLTLVQSIGYDTFRFGHAGSGATSVDDSGLDKNQINGGASAEYWFYPGLSAVAAVQETSAEFIHRGPQQPNPNYMDTLILAGVNYDPKAFFKYDILIGYQRRSFASSSFATLSVPVIEASVAYTPTRLTTLTLVGIRHLSDASYNVADNETYSEGRFRIDHALRRNILLDARFDVTHGDGNATDFARTQITFGCGARWLISPHVQVALDYNFNHGDSGIHAFGKQAASGTYSASSINLSLRLQL
jgi:hypothetical protein